MLFVYVTIGCTWPDTLDSVMIKMLDESILLLVTGRTLVAPSG